MAAEIPMSTIIKKPMRGSRKNVIQGGQMRAGRAQEFKAQEFNSEFGARRSQAGDNRTPKCGKNEREVREILRVAQDDKPCL